MKKYALVLVSGLLVATLFLAFKFYNSNLKGIWPAVTSSKTNIVDLFPNNSSENISKEKGTNTTNFPLKLPDGFSISLFAKNLGDPRVLLKDNQGTLLVSIPSKGQVLAFPDEDRNGVADKTIVVAKGLNRPHGLALRCEGICTLYIAESDGVDTFDYNQQTKEATNKKRIISLPNGGGHWSRTLLINKNKLLIAVGSSCNVCNESDWKRAKILSADLDGNNLKEYSKGLRNSVFMAVNPTTSDIWATEMGRDLLGDDIPPDEINIIKENQNYGWPVCFGKNIHDTEFDKNTYIRNPCQEPLETPSLVDLQAHSAPLGLSFIPKDGWPTDFANDLLVSFHGSWNRTVPTGYKVVRVKFDENQKFVGIEDFLTGWIEGNNALGRPVDILTENRGVFYLTDDKAGVIYKGEYSK